MAQVELHKQGGSSAAGSSSASLGDGSPQEGLRDLALMEALLGSAARQGALEQVQQVQ